MWECADTDHDLVRRVAAGDDGALRLLYERHAGWLAARLGQRCPDHNLVEEAVQDTFVAAWRGAGRYLGTGAVGAWLWGIAARRLVDCVRRRPPASAAVDSWDGWDAWPEPKAEEGLASALEALDVRSVIARLPVRERGVAAAMVLDGLTSRETAARLGVPEGTVKTRFMRARAGMRLLAAADGGWAA